MDMETALSELGVTDDLLDAKTKAQLDTDGFAPLPGILSPEQADAFGQRLAELSKIEGSRAGEEVHQEAGTDRLSDLVNKDPMFEVCFTHPVVLAAIRHVLGEFRLSSLNSRAALPGQGHQGLHADWGVLQEGQGFQVCNSIWLLDDFTAENGATRVVPGSHRKRGKAPADELGGDPRATHPDEVQLIAPAGTVVVFNSHLWHGGTRNNSDRPRRALHSYFTRRDMPQQLDQAEYLRVRTRDRLSPAALYVLGVWDELGMSS
ncbi:phytanoyl-CoA dioxygenase family protein [Actinopolymorpha rutila]|uniref:Ectoine hydroxylase-related dioxygenase (Phytanoyl-CoA dioxygenase family) n=1 Tax=Actinopolymorpha rutila TaxID=446787 RepID=A0A852ZG64_9ACTN|nr:phytanoyl-CoA dioxygenase family protein [Actinopolymorpha rutila]NYH92097.1 ectoine hydroxylase-related dioxygenase (phytanoyl-CoA dioxygenase family) [Actinopolymorpha rutila]